MESFSVSRGRSFDHCVITWKIKNYGLAVWQRDWEVATPEFSVGERGIRTTKWKLILQTCEQQKRPAGSGSVEEPVDSRKKDEFSAEDSVPKAGPVETDPKHPKSTESKYHKIEYRSRHVFLHLQRVALDEGPANVWVDWRVHCLAARGEKCFITEKEHFFGKEHRHTLNLGIIFDSEREFLYNSGVMTYFCEMIIKKKNEVMYDTPRKSLDTDLRNLSEDFEWMFSQENFCDLVITVGERKILAHKAILCSRSEFFENMFKKEGFERIELTDVNYDAMLKCLAYIYSGNLEDVIGKSSNSIYDAIKHLNLSGLLEHYIPEEKSVYTELDARKVIYTWDIKDFSTKNENCLSSPIITSSCTDASFRINLYPRGVDNKSDHVAVHVEHLEGEVSDNCTVQCAILEKHKTFYVWRTLQKSLNDEHLYKDQKFIARVTLPEVINDDVLKIGFKFRMPSVLKSDSLHSEKLPSIVPFTESKSLKKLSDDMYTLYESRKFTDITIFVGNEKFEAHRYILCARSCILSSILEEENKNYAIFSGVTPQIFRVLLKYMYCAVLSVYDVKMLFDVYKAAAEFGICRLSKKCSHILVNFLSIETARDILHLAEKCYDEFLKMEALKFISLNEANRRELLKDLSPRKSVHSELHIKSETNEKSLKSPKVEKNEGEDETIKATVDKSIDFNLSYGTQEALAVSVEVVEEILDVSELAPKKDSSRIDAVKSSESEETVSCASGESFSDESPGKELLTEEPLSAVMKSPQNEPLPDSPTKRPSVPAVQSPLKEQTTSDGDSPPKGQSL